MEDEVMKYFGDPEDAQFFQAPQNKDVMSFQADHVFLEDSNSTEGQFSALTQQEQQPFQYSFDPFAPKYEDNNTSSPDWSDENRAVPPFLMSGGNTGGGFLANRHKVFTIHRDEESGETPKTEAEASEMSKCSKTIQKKEKCSIKGRKRTFGIESESTNSNYSREMEVNSINEQVEEEMKKYQHLDDEEKKRMQQMLRNRISAQSSRDRKKNYMATLEKENQILKKEITKLRNDIQQSTRQYLPCRFCGRSDSDNSGVEPLLGGQSYIRSTGTGMRNAFALVSMISLCLIIGIMAPGELNVQQNTIAGIRKYRINQEEVTARDKTYKSLSKMLSPETMYRLENQKLLRKLRDMQDELGKTQLQTGCEAAMRKNTMAEERNASYAQKAFEERNKSMDHGDKKFLSSEPRQPLFYPEKTESVFCPNGIILDYIKNNEALKDSHFTGKEVGIGERFQNKTWLQLFVPTKNFSILTKDHSQKYVNVKEEDDGKETKMLELICNIQNAREFSA